jgi:hypothetical protein
MAAATNPRDIVRRIAITSGAWTEIKCSQHCLAVEVRQLGSETPAVFLVKHQSDSGGEDAEYVGANGLWEKGKLFGTHGPGAKKFQVGDTFGFFQSVPANMVLVVRELEV